MDTSIATQQQHDTGLAAQDTYNPYEAYGNKTAGQDRTILKFSKGDWTYGIDATPIIAGHQLVANMAGLQIGWIRWWDGKPTDEVMVLVADGIAPPLRNSLGDDDPQMWEIDDQTSKPRDPWQNTNQLPLKDQDSGEEMVFATSSRGGISAIGKLAQVYGAEYRQRPGQFPIIEIGVDSYKHSNKAFGIIKVPILELVGWVHEADVVHDAAEPVTVAKPDAAKKVARQTTRQAAIKQAAIKQAAKRDATQAAPIESTESTESTESNISIDF